MPYNRQIPDAPLPVSMLPRASSVSSKDLLLLVKPNNDPGNKTKHWTNNKRIQHNMKAPKNKKEFTINDRNADIMANASGDLSLLDSNGNFTGVCP